MRKAAVEALLVTDFTNVSYLTGFSGDDSFLLVHPQGEVLISDARYTTQIDEECPSIERVIRRTGVPMQEATAKVLRRSKFGAAWPSRRTRSRSRYETRSSSESRELSYTPLPG